jgi:hypothetical protein
MYVYRVRVLSHAAGNPHWSNDCCQWVQRYKYSNMCLNTSIFMLIHWCVYVYIYRILCALLIRISILALGTLEQMHEVLASRGLDDLLPSQGGLAFENSNRPRSTSIPSLPHHKANIWVVRYVDYTSKYGLGFLLNTGSAGGWCLFI